MRFTEFLGAIAVLVTVLFDASTVSAHAFETRYDLPLPLTLFITGAGAAVANEANGRSWWVLELRPRTECLNLLQARQPGFQLQYANCVYRIPDHENTQSLVTLCERCRGCSNS